jgi:hypothetical protein
MYCGAASDWRFQLVVLQVQLAVVQRRVPSMVPVYAMSMVSFSSISSVPVPSVASLATLTLWQFIIENHRFKQVHQHKSPNILKEMGRFPSLCSISKGHCTHPCLGIAQIFFTLTRVHPICTLI